MWEQLLEWDKDLLVFLNNLGASQFDSFWIFVTQIKHWIPVYIIFFILYLKFYTRKKAVLGIFFTVVALFASLGITSLVKFLVERLRPNNNPEIFDAIRVLQTPENFSFFSGHATVSLAVTTFVVLALRKRIRWVYFFYIWPILFIPSRIYVGVHYPSDLLAGGFVGFMLAIVLWKAVAKKQLVST